MLTTRYNSKKEYWIERTSMNEYSTWDSDRMNGYARYRDCDDSLQTEWVFGEECSFEEFVLNVTKQRVWFWDLQMLPYVMLGKFVDEPELIRMII